MNKVVKTAKVTRWRDGSSDVEIERKATVYYPIGQAPAYNPNDYRVKKYINISPRSRDRIDKVISKLVNRGEATIALDLFGYEVQF